MVVSEIGDICAGVILGEAIAQIGEKYHRPTKNYIVPELFIYIRGGERCNLDIWLFRKNQEEIYA